MFLFELEYAAIGRGMRMKTLPTSFILSSLTSLSTHSKVGIVVFHMYRIAGNFQGRKLLRIGEKYEFHGENFHRLLACAAPRTTCPQILRRKLSRIATKTWNLQKFSPSKVSCYMVYMNRKHIEDIVKKLFSSNCHSSFSFYILLHWNKYITSIPGSHRPTLSNETS